MDESLAAVDGALLFTRLVGSGDQWLCTHSCALVFDVEHLLTFNIVQFLTLANINFYVVTMLSCINAVFTVPTMVRKRYRKYSTFDLH